MLTVPSKHAIRAALYMSEQSRDVFLPVKTLAQEAGIPPAYLSKIIKKLSEEGLLITKKGAGGGVQLPKHSISFYDICEALNDPIIEAKCFLMNSACSANNPCEFHETWRKERGRILRFLQKSLIKPSRSG